MRTRSLAAAAAVSCLAAVAACGDTSDPAKPSGKVSDLPCDVETFIATNCRECHADPPRNTAPMSLVTVADFQRSSISAPDKRVGDVVIDRLSSTQKRMPPLPRDEATASEKQTMANWLAAGLPARAGSDACATGTGGSGGGPTTSCTPDLVLKAASPWTMPKETADEYVCFGVELPATGDDRHITALFPKVDNTKIVHHLLVYRVDETEKISPVPKPCAQVVKQGWKLYYAWGPGTPPAVLPAEAGYRMPGGKSTHYIVNVHYSNLTMRDGETDATAIELCTEPPRAHDADVMAVGSTKFTLPAHGEKTIECSSHMSIIPATDPFTVFQTWPHMHLLGTHMSSEIVHNDGTKTPIIDKPYDFYNQVTYPTRLTLEKSDKIITRCSWNNTTDGSVGYGEDTSDEMCFNFLSFYPAPASDAEWAWIVPAAIAGCKLRRPVGATRGALGRRDRVRQRDDLVQHEAIDLVDRVDVGAVIEPFGRHRDVVANKPQQVGLLHRDDVVGLDRVVRGALAKLGVERQRRRHGGQIIVGHLDQAGTEQLVEAHPYRQCQEVAERKRGVGHRAGERLGHTRRQRPLGRLEARERLFEALFARVVFLRKQPLDVLERRRRHPGVGGDWTNRCTTDPHAPYRIGSPRSAQALIDNES